MDVFTNWHELKTQILVRILVGNKHDEHEVFRLVKYTYMLKSRNRSGVASKKVMHRFCDT